MVLLNQLHKPGSTEELAFTVRSLRDSVRMKYKNISGLQCHSPFFIGHFFENAERKTRQFNFAAAPIFVEQGLRLPGVCHSKLLAAFLPGRKTRRHESPFNAPL